MHNSIVQVRSPLLLLILSIGFFMLCDAALFRSGLYAHIANPDALSAQLFNTVYFENKRPPSGKKEVLITGHSMIHWAFWAKLFEQEHPEADITFIQDAIAGATERMWYFILEDIDPHANRYATIIIPINSYKVDSWHADEANNYSGAEMLAPIMKPGQWPELINSFSDLKIRSQVTMLALFPSHQYATDIVDLFSHPLDRRKAFMEHHRAKWNWLADWKGSEGSMEDLKLDSNGKVIAFPSALNAFERKDAVEEFTPILPEDAVRYTERNASFKSYWLTKIVERYKNSPTKIIFLQLPRWPMILPARKPIANAPDLRKMIPAQSNVTFLPESEFTFIEQPKYFYDAKHVNKEGRRLFTERLGAVMLQMMTVQ